MSEPRSRNPFDSPRTLANSHKSDDESEESFYDCLEIEENAQEPTKKERRSANINFENPFDGVEAPALDFQQPLISTEFFSPLESAMMQIGNSLSGRVNSSFDTELGTSEDSPLLGGGSGAINYSDLTISPGRKDSANIPSEISTRENLNEYGNCRKRKKSRHIPSVKTKQGLVLKELAEGENEFSMDYKYILLEDLGTASSWIILLLPYFAFILCLLLESSATLTKSYTTQPLGATMLCDNSITDTKLLMPPTTACHCYFKRHEKEIQNGELNSTESSLLYEGYVFESGVVNRIPVIATYLYGDAIFTSLSTESVALVAQGSLEVEVEVLQQELSKEWSVMYMSNKKTVSMACDKRSDGTWDCKTPRIIDIVFSMPETLVYAGGDISTNVYYSLNTGRKTKNDYHYSGNTTIDISHVYTKGKDAASLISYVHSTDNSLVEEIVVSSEYTLEHMSYLAMKVDTFVRLATFLVSVCFLFYWLYNMGMKSLFSGFQYTFDYCFPTSKTATEWWESHWILFPERYYILLLLFSLLLVQEPVLAAMVLSPMLGSSTELHIAADATIGIGVHGILFVYLCLFHGFRYHTAAVSKKRAEHQRQILQLRRAAKYVNDEANLISPTERAISKYTEEFYENYGDIYGILSNNYRLQNDPCGDSWADFLLFKILIFLVGIASVVSTAYCRFPPEVGASSALDNDSLNKYRTIFVVSSIVNFVVLLLWILAIIKAALVTGQYLRSEKFLSTRPVQLAYRIIFAHTTLGFAVLFVSFCLRIHMLATKWSLNDAEDSIAQEEDVSEVETAIRVLSQVAVTFPYSGTAASVGAGRVFFATVSILITAFIFLPAHHLEDEEEDTGRKGVIQEKLKEQRRLKRDKRLVVHLAKESKTWRVFPLPIDQSVPTNMLEDNVFQLYKGLFVDDNIRDRGVVSLGPYTPIFCLEIACWLNEASWQAYYSPAGISSKTTGTAPGGMNLESLGLRLEGAVFDEVTDTQVYIATNMSAQVDGEEDSTIVVSFRGTANASNLQTDLRSRQVPLLDQLTGIEGTAPFCIHPDRLEIADSDGWIWDTPKIHGENLQCVTSWGSSRPLCMPSHCARGEGPTPLKVVSKGARAILQATPVARESFPLVHEGFQEVYTHIRKKLLDILFPVLQRQLVKSLEMREPKDGLEPLALPKIYCTGHSLGGSLAQLLALDLASNCEIVLPTKVDTETFHDSITPETEVFHLPETYQEAIAFEETVTVTKELRLQPPIAVYTFGQPRVGNKQFTRFYKQRVPHTFRIVNEGDPITSMPNRYLFCSGVYKHAGLEVLLDEGMTGNILVGPTVVETIFRFSPVRTNMLAHTMTRYRDCLECAFGEHELLEYYQGHNVSKEDKQKRGCYRQSNVTTKTEIPEWMTQVGSKKK